ncbi:MAG: MBL fold metallo-hydrolase [bacterium]|nr:MBL fold metallo-hydrolase [bacterium]
MKATLWGTRGSLARSGPETLRYGGDTSSVEVRGSDDSLIVIDAGSGILRLGENIGDPPSRIDLLLSHLHMDHIQGLGFFTPLYAPDIEVHIWGPVSATQDLRSRLTRYLSPPLFPVRLRDLASVEIHDLQPGVLELGAITVTAEIVTHPGHTMGLRLEDEAGVLTYISDHEPALGVTDFPRSAEWTSGAALAEGANVLIHDAQYTDEEYEERVGWGHSSFKHAVAFAELVGAKKMVTFHHDPSHSDDFLDLVTGSLRSDSVEIVGGTVGAEFVVGS